MENEFKHRRIWEFTQHHIYLSTYGGVEWVNPNCETEVGKKLQKFRDKPWENEKCGAENMDFFLMESSHLLVVYVSTV